ncbi:AraC family transcriptional regulator [Wenyingzhuangia sp. IMCC45574]
MNNVSLPVFKISNFIDYKNCIQDFEANFYIRQFKDHLCENCFLEKPHSHDFYLILIITSGQGKHYIDAKEYDVRTGAFFIIPPGQIHRWELSDDTDGYVLFFTKKYFLLGFDHQKFEAYPFFKMTFAEPHVLLNYDELNNVVKIFKKIHSEYSNRTINFHEMIRLYMGQLFVNLTRVYYNKSYVKQVSNYELIQLTVFESLIEEHFKEHQPVPFYAEKMSLSIKQLSYMCKKVLNKTPSEMIQDRLILEAQRLILHTELPIKHISNVLNFNESSYFNRMFKRTCNKTPEQYRSSFTSFISNNY